MKSDDAQPGSAANSHADFATTRWSLIVAASEGQQPAAQQALETLCTAYWYPLYAYIRRQGYRGPEAEDLTQGFFAMLLDRRDLAKFNPERGRFRSFLLTALKHFLANQLERERALKRGGGQRVISLDFLNAEHRYAGESASGTAPDRLYDKQWALELLDRVASSLHDEYAAAGKQALYQRLSAIMTASITDDSYAAIAAELEMSVGAVKVAAHRLRQRFGQRLRSEIAETVLTPEDVDTEIRELFQVLQG
jgi:RNA polymerase sigma-70 factor (ECF subfamily)